MQPIEETKREMCEIGRRMYQAGFVAANDGNISVRLGGGRYLCTPTGVSKGFMTPDMICVVDDEGTQLEGRLPRSSEVLLHLLIYHELPAIGAVAHAHPPYATAFAAAGIAPPVGVLPEAEIFLGPVPLADYGCPGRQELAESIIPHLHNKANTILLANHGVVTCDKTLLQAYFHIETVDSYCRIITIARQLGNVNHLSEARIRELLEIKKSLGIDDPRMPEP
jgi:L-fuculose-phosphate aldolase